MGSRFNWELQKVLVMFYFCIFYIIPCLLNAWFTNKQFSNGEIDLLTANALMFMSIVPIINLLQLMVNIKSLFNN